MSDAPSPSALEREDRSGHFPRWRVLLALFLGVLVWPSVWFGLYVHHSAPLAFLLYHGVCLCGGLILRKPGLPPAKRVHPLDYRLLIAGVVVANMVVLLFYRLAGGALLDRLHVLSLLTTTGLPTTTYWYLFPYFALINPLLEEYFWRRGVYANLVWGLRRELPAALAASFLFGAWHWLVIRLFVAPPVALFITLIIMAVGFALTTVYEKTRRLAYPILLHAFAGDTPLLMLLLVLQRA